MIIAAIYPVFVWFLVYRLRRTLIGISLPFVSAALVVLIAPLLQTMIGRSAVPLLPLLYAEAGLLLAVGLWLSLMPRPVPTGSRCEHCGYSLAGLDTAVQGALCPECGGDVTPPSLRKCDTCGTSLANVDLSRRGQRCRRCSTILPWIRPK